MSNLEPCPFCNKTDTVYFIETRVDGMYYSAPKIGCSECGFYREGCVVNIGDAEKSEQFSDNLLRKWWNRRPAEDALKAEVEKLKAVIDESTKPRTNVIGTAVQAARKEVFFGKRP